MFKKTNFSVVISLGILSIIAIAPGNAQAAAPKSRDLRGRILIETESFNRAWYVTAKNNRYYLKSGPEMIETVGSLAIGISNRDLAKISAVAGKSSNASLLARLRGRFLLAVESQGQLWYVRPQDGRRVPVDKNRLTDFLKAEGLAVKDSELKTVAMNTEQVMFDPTFQGVATAKLVEEKVVSGQASTAIRPIASLTKLMTALVLLETPLDWTKLVTITDSVIGYPRELVGGAGTSEVDLKTGDIVPVEELWIAMLVASSNQSAVALVDASGLSRPEFVARMNEKAAALGLKQTKFYEMTGLDSHNVSTAAEMAKLAAAAFAVPKIGNDTNILDRTFSVVAADGTTRAVRVLDRNLSLRAFGVEAAKTGYLTEARSNAAIKKDGAVIVVLHASGVADRNNTIKKFLN